MATVYLPSQRMDKPNLVDNIYKEKKNIKNNSQLTEMRGRKDVGHFKTPWSTFSLLLHWVSIHIWLKVRIPPKWLACGFSFIKITWESSPFYTSMKGCKLIIFFILVAKINIDSFSFISFIFTTHKEKWYCLHYIMIKENKHVHLSTIGFCVRIEVSKKHQFVE